MGAFTDSRFLHRDPLQQFRRRFVVRVLLDQLAAHDELAGFLSAPYLGRLSRQDAVTRDLGRADAPAGGYGGIFVPLTPTGAMLVALGVSQSGQTAFAAAFLIWE